MYKTSIYGQPEDYFLLISPDQSVENLTTEYAEEIQELSAQHLPDVRHTMCEPITLSAVNRKLESSLIPNFRRTKQVSVDGNIISKILNLAVVNTENVTWLASFMERVYTVKQTVSDDYIHRANSQLGKDILNLIQLLDETFANVDEKTCILRNFEDMETENIAQTGYAIQMILLHLKHYPNDAVFIQKSGGLPSKYLQRFSSVLKHFENCIHHRLIPTTFEKHERGIELYKLWSRKMEHEMKISELQKMISDTRDDYFPKMQKKTVVIEQLRNEILAVQLIENSAMKYDLQDSNKIKRFEENKHWENETELVIETKRAMRNLHEVVKLHVKTENRIRARKSQVENELYTAFERYDEEMYGRDKQYYDLIDDIEQQNKEIQILESELYRMKPEYQDIMAVKFLESEKERMKYEEMMKRERAALLIQAFWRRWHYLRMKKLDELGISEQALRKSEKKSKKAKSKKSKNGESDVEETDEVVKVVKKAKLKKKGKKKGDLKTDLKLNDVIDDEEEEEEVVEEEEEKWLL